MSAQSICFNSAPTTPPLDAAVIRRLIADRAPDWQVRVIDEIDSTNSSLLREARQNADAFIQPALLAAALQTAGRGRSGRSWQAAPDASLTVSFGWRMQRSLAELSGLSLVCGLALHAALLQQGVNTRLKWPNDVLAGWDQSGDHRLRKLAGILIETQVVSNPATHHAATIIVIGIGVNLTPAAYQSLNTPDTQRQGPFPALPATDLQSEGASHADRNHLIAALAENLTMHLQRFETGGFNSFVDDWNAIHAFQNRTVAASGQGRIIEGVARGVNALGQLLLETPDGRHNLNSGDISLRPR